MDTTLQRITGERAALEQMYEHSIEERNRVYAERDALEQRVGEVERERDEAIATGARSMIGDLGRLVTKVWDERGAMVRERDALAARLQAVEGALEEAVKTIRIWHGMGMGEFEAETWALYQGSPEMLKINAARPSGQTREAG